MHKTTCEAQVSTKKEESEGEKEREKAIEKKELPCRKRRRKGRGGRIISSSSREKGAMQQKRWDG